MTRWHRPRPPARRTNRWGWLAWLCLPIFVALGALALAVGGALLLERAFFYRAYPNITVRGLDVGGMTRDQARNAILRHYQPLLQRPITLRYGERTWQPHAAELGIALDAEAAADQALALGHSGDRERDAQTAAALWEYGLELPITVQVDTQQAQRYLQALARELEQAPRNADLQLRGLQIVRTSEQFGTQLLIDESLREIVAAAQTLSPATIELRTRQIAPEVRDRDLEPVLAQLTTILSGPLVLLSDRDLRWEWGPAELMGWISLEREGFGYRIIRDREAIRAALLPVASAVREEGGLPRVAWNGGDLQIVTPGAAGRGLDLTATLIQIETALNGGSRLIELPMVATAPPVNAANLASLGIRAPVGEGVSSFIASAEYRITNIQAGARRMDGVLIPPGGEFSFNTHLGRVDAANGFVQGLAIIDNRTQKEWGGGLCQVSTTVFRAAFWGGFPIEERHEHSFRIGWYEELGEPPGLDAAIFTPYQDMRFVNDSANWLLVESEVDLRRQRLTVRLYGTPDGRSVAMDYRVLERTPAPSEPVYVDDPEQPLGTVRQSDTARGGMTVEVYRTVFRGAELLTRDTFGTEFRPWPDIFVRGTGR